MDSIIEVLEELGLTVLLIAVDSVGVGLIDSVGVGLIDPVGLGDNDPAGLTVIDSVGVDDSDSVGVEVIDPVGDRELLGDIDTDELLETEDDNGTRAYEIENTGSPFGFTAIGTAVGKIIVRVEFCGTVRPVPVKSIYCH